MISYTEILHRLSLQHHYVQRFLILIIILLCFVCGQIGLTTIMDIYNNSSGTQFNNKKQKMKSVGVVGGSISDTTTILQQSTTTFHNPFPLQCIYDVNNHTECLYLLSQHMNASLTYTRSTFLSSIYKKKIINQQQYNILQQDTYVNRRYVIFGDSTFYRLHHSSSLQNVFMNESIQLYQQYRTNSKQRQHNNNKYQWNNPMVCTTIYADRCNRMELLGLIKPYTNWREPNYTNGEGPNAFGLENAYCSDCSGCDTAFATCKKGTNIIPDNNDNNNIDIDIDDDNLWLNDDDNELEEIEKQQEQQQQYIGPSYGGFMMIEFARDVELQSIEYETSQENYILNYIGKQWNTPIDMVIEFGYPICIAGVGLHDFNNPGMTESTFQYNMKWYIQILLSQCEYLIWVSNTAPLTDEYAQTKEKVYQWNMDVLEILVSSNEYMSRSFFLDVFDASVTYKYEDNVHMAPIWYEILGSMFIRLMSMKLG